MMSDVHVILMSVRHSMDIFDGFTSPWRLRFIIVELIPYPGPKFVCFSMIINITGNGYGKGVG